MRVAWVTPELPYWPGGSGGSTRQYQLIRRLIDLGHEVDVVAPVHPDQRDGVASLEAAGATLFGSSRPHSRRSEVTQALWRRPRLAAQVFTMPLLAWQVEVFWTALRDQAQAALARRPDVVLVEHDWAARWIDALPSGTPKVLALENLTWEYYRLRAAEADGPRAMAMSVEARRWLRFDRKRLARYDLLLAMSESDRASVARVVPTPTVVVANGVDTSRLQATALPNAPVALFTGTFAYPPNTEALRWLLDEIWPRVQERMPEAKLIVVGKGVPDELSAAAAAGIQFTGFVPEMQPWFDRAQVVLVPMRSGAGTRLKVLDGLASGRPVLSTTMGATGVAVTDGTDVVLADGAEGFADAAIALLRDPALCEQIGGAGRRLATERYEWDRIGDLLEASLQDLRG